MTRIAEAYSDENKKARGGIRGDQTGREIRITEWYRRDGGWSVYIECNDEQLAEAAAYNAELIAQDDKFGYNQDDRWSGYDEIISAGSIDEAEKGDFDCSSHVLASYILAGLKIKPEGYTKNIERILVETGKFTSYRDEAHLRSAALAKRGGIYLEPGKHTFMVLEDGGGIVEAIESITAPTLPNPTEKRVFAKGSVRVRTAPIDGAKMMTLRKGESLPYVGVWYVVDVDGKRGYISANKKYTEVR